jgi:acetyl esterase/lipase
LLQIRFQSTEYVSVRSKLTAKRFAPSFDRSRFVRSSYRIEDIRPVTPHPRAPAAIEDGADFLSWLHRQAELAGGGDADPWLAESADFARMFISGDSAGANLAHHLAVQVASAQLAVRPVRVVGYVLFSAFFASTERTAAETNPSADLSLTVEMADQLWHMALPVGASRDHPFANPFGPDSPSLATVDLPPVLVVAPGNDMLRETATTCTGTRRG